MTELGKELKIARVRAGITLKELSKSIGYAPTYVSLIEKGTYKVSKKLLEKIEKYFAELGVELPPLEPFIMLHNKEIDMSSLSDKKKQLLIKVYYLNDKTVNKLLEELK